MIIGLIGGTGFIGQWLVKEWSIEHRFKVLSRRPISKQWYSNKNIEYYYSDFSIDDMCKGFSDCECIVNLGGVLSTPDREKSILNYTENIELAEKVFSVGKNLGIYNIVNISSRTVYNHDLDGPYCESDIPSPMNLYAVVKLAIENMSFIYNRKYDMRIKNLRLAQVFGAGGRNGYMMEVFKEQARKKETLKVIGNQGKELLYVKDAAEAIIRALEKNDISGTFNIGSGEFILNKDIAEGFCNVYGNDNNIIFENGDGGRTKRNYMDITKAANELSFKPQHDFQRALLDIKKEENCES